jgi:hypothetical protein
MKYDLIVGIGCSFTEGGGLDNPNIYKFLNKITDGVDYSWPNEIPMQFKKENNYIAYLAKILNCEYINLSESMSSNDLIFQKTYDYFKKENLSDRNILFIGQITLFSRQHVYYDYTKEFKKLNKIEFSEPPFENKEKYKPLHEYYTNYLSFVYNEDIALKNIERNIDLYTNWLIQKNIYPLWLSYDGNSSQFEDNDNFIKFEGENLGAYAKKNKLRLADIPNCPENDLHLSMEGHNIVANMIYKKLINKSLIQKKVI